MVIERNQIVRNISYPQIRISNNNHDYSNDGKNDRTTTSTVVTISNYQYRHNDTEGRDENINEINEISNGSIQINRYGSFVQLSSYAEAAGSVTQQN